LSGGDNSRPRHIRELANNIPDHALRCDIRPGAGGKTFTELDFALRRR
jgi:hypothetical protein